MDDERLILAIGDVHGEAGLLERLLDGVPAIEGKAGRAISVAFLGDIVDRGPDSRKALDLVDATLRDRPGSRLLLGNHDDWFRRFLEDELDEADTANWLGQGGLETLLSYEADIERRDRGIDPNERRLAVLRQRPRHLGILSDASIIERAGAYAFVHAGVDPSRPIYDQRREDCVWIRAAFLKHVGVLGHVVVHGHQPQKGGLPVVTENRISMDTGAVFGGALSAVLLDPTNLPPLAFFQVVGNRGPVPVDPRRLDRGFGTVVDPADA